VGPHPKGRKGTILHQLHSQALKVTALRQRRPEPLARPSISGQVQIASLAPLKVKYSQRMAAGDALVGSRMAAQLAVTALQCRRMSRFVISQQWR
jgi:hypothetical protein